MNLDNRNNLHSEPRLNITSTSSINCFDFNDQSSFRLDNRSSWGVGEMRSEKAGDLERRYSNPKNPVSSSWLNGKSIFSTTETGFFSPTSEYCTDALGIRGEEKITSVIHQEGSSSAYNSTSGYGFIDASAAVGKAIGKSPLTDVPDVGGNNWGADLIKAPEAWAQGYTGKDVVVAVLDTGVDYNHNDLQSNIWTNTTEIAGNGKDDDGNGYIDDVYGWNFHGDNNITLDGNGHGTHVAGTIAGANNGYGVTGIAYDAKIMPVKVLDDSGTGSYTAIANGIYYAVNNGADVINLSLGGDSPNFILELAIQYASAQGVIVVMAAGNESASAPGYPARYAENWGIAVGAVDKNNNMAEFSNKAGTNPLTYVTAPGVNIYSTIPGNEYASYNGTSMAVPHVAGVVALMLSANSNLTDTQVRQILAETSGNHTTATTFTLNMESFIQPSTTTSSLSLEQDWSSADKTWEWQTSSHAFSASEFLWTDNTLNPQNQYSLSDITEAVNENISVNPVLWSQFLSDHGALVNKVHQRVDNDDDNDNGNNVDDILNKSKILIEEYLKWLE
jgi:subtilisin